MSVWGWCDGGGGSGGGRTFNGRVVLVYEVALDELYGQAGFTNTSASYHDELVFSEELQRAEGSAIGSGAV